MIDLKANQALSLRRWIDPELPVGVDQRSRYVDHYWIPTLGPTAVCLARLLMRMTARRGDVVVVQTDHLTSVLGLHHDDGDEQVTRSLDALHGSGVLAVDADGTVLVQAQFPFLTEAQVDRLPEALAVAHRAPGSLRAAAGLDAHTSDATALGPHARILSLASTVDEILVNESLDAGQLAFRWQHVVRLAEEARDDAVLDWAPTDLEPTLAECHLAAQAVNEALWATQRAIATRRTVGDDQREVLSEAAAGVIDWLVSEFPRDAPLYDDEL